jgi:hypothetical protein
MNNSEVEALLQHKKVLQRLILTKNNVVEVKKHKKELQSGWVQATGVLR